MTDDNLLLTGLGFVTGALFGEALLQKCRKDFFEKSKEEKAETIALTILSELCIAADTFPSIAPIFQGASFGLTITSLSVAKNSSNPFYVFTNLGTIGAVFYYHISNNQDLAPQAVFPVILVLGLISSLRQRNIESLIEENVELEEELDELDHENEELFEEVSVLVEENAEEANARAQELEELARLRAYKPFIDHHIQTGHASPRQLKSARERYQAIHEYTTNPSQTPRRSLSRTRTSKMVANNKISKHSKS